MPNEVREAIDRRTDLHQSSRSVLVQPLEPCGDGGWLKQERFGGLGERPGASGFDLQNGHAEYRRIVRPAVGQDCGQSSVLDAEFFAEHGYLGAKMVDLGCLANADVNAIGCPAAGVGDGVVCDGHGVSAADLMLFGHVRGSGIVRGALFIELTGMEFSLVECSGDSIKSILQVEN